MTTLAPIPILTSSSTGLSPGTPSETVFMTLFLLESSRQMLSRDQASAQPSSYLRQHLPSELSVKAYWESLAEGDRERLREYWGERGLEGLMTLSREEDLELYLEAILHLGQSLVKKDRLAPALFLFELVARRAQGPFPKLAEQAKSERDAVVGPLNPLVGKVNWGRRLEFLNGRVMSQLMDPALALGMFADQWGFFTGRGATLLKLLNPAAVKLPWYTRATAHVAGFALEAPLYAAAHRGVNYLLDRKGIYGSFGEEVLGIWTLRGGMYLGKTLASLPGPTLGYLGGKFKDGMILAGNKSGPALGAFAKLGAGIGWTGEFMGRRVLQWSPVQRVTVSLGTFGGIVMGNGIGVMADLRNPTNLDGLLLDSFVTSLHYYGLRGPAARSTMLPL